MQLGHPRIHQKHQDTKGSNPGYTRIPNINQARTKETKDTTKIFRILKTQLGYTRMPLRHWIQLGSTRKYQDTTKYHLGYHQNNQGTQGTQDTLEHDWDITMIYWETKDQPQNIPVAYSPNFFNLKLLFFLLLTPSSLVPGRLLYTLPGFFLTTKLKYLSVRQNNSDNRITLANVIKPTLASMETIRRTDITFPLHACDVKNYSPIYYNQASPCRAALT